MSPDGTKLQKNILRGVPDVVGRLLSVHEVCAGRHTYDRAEDNEEGKDAFTDAAKVENHSVLPVVVVSIL